MTESWGNVRIAEVVNEARTGFASGEDIDDGVLQVRMNNIGRDGAFDWAKHRRVPLPPKGLQGYEAMAGDVLFNHTNSPDLVGKSAYFEGLGEPVTFSNHFICLRPNAKQLHGKYLARWLHQQWSHGRFQGLCKQWVNQATVSKEALLNLRLPLPPLDEQKRIAAILDQADELRRKRQRAIDRLNQLGQAIFYEMFGDPLDNPRDGVNWTIASLDEHITFMDYRGKTPLKAQTGVRLITAKNVRMGYIQRDPQEFVEAHSYDEWMTRGFPKRGDILFTTEAPLGNVAQLDTDERVVIGQRLLTLKPNLHVVKPIYLEFFLRTVGFTRRMYENSTGSTVVGIKSKLLKKIDFRYPTLDLQTKFERAVTEVRKLGEETRTGFRHAQNLFGSLQSRAFRGEL